ncbi:aminotransferase class IV [Lewinella sp. IMCC34183]|uniref:aminotransferase class IV n=1 Tax=Lewinella sp. IMCC34183 TaxID=2248762 RepID=UPI000E226E62|nr:aminotransferase class IV [Lewinella sp. IMCC34183]
MAPSAPHFLETIRIVDGQPQLLSRHQTRVDRTRHRFFGKAPAFRLSRVIDELDLPASGVHKLRIVYGASLESAEVHPYTIRPVRSLRVIEADDLRYGKKYADRSHLEKLFAQRAGCDDVLIVQRNHLTDSSYANLAFHDGNKWYTPAWPLLPGTRREELIDRGVLFPTVIRLRDLYQFEEVRLVNAMMEWEESPTIPTTAVLRH